MITKYIPGDRAGLTAAQAGHDGVHAAGHKTEFSIAGIRCPKDAVGLIRLNNCDDRSFRIPVQGSKVAADCTGHRTDTGLKKDVGRFLLLKLTGCLCRHGGIAFHDPAGNFFITFPGGVLDKYPAKSIRVFFGFPDRIVIIQFRDGGIGAQRLYISKSFRGTALRHVDNTFLSQTIGCPGDAAAVVSVGGGHKGKRTELFPDLAGNQLLIGQFFQADTELFCDVIADGMTSAEYLEGIQTKTVTFVLHMNRGNAMRFRQSIKSDQRGLPVFRKTAVEAEGLCCAVRTETVHRTEISPAFPGKMYCLNPGVLHVHSSC